MDGRLIQRWNAQLVKYISMREYDIYKHLIIIIIIDKMEIDIDIVIYSEGNGENKTYSISSIQIPNVVTQGDTIEEAKMRLREALGLYFESAPWECERLIRIENEENNNSLMISKLVLVS